jgi:hypothetical protein
MVLFKRIGEALMFNLKEIEKRTIIAALKAYGGNVSRARVVLGISKQTFYVKVRKYGIDLKQIREYNKNNDYSHIKWKETQNGPSLSLVSGNR